MKDKKNPKIQPNDKGVNEVINPGRILTKTPGPETEADSGISNMPSGEMPTGDGTDSVLGG